MTASRQAQRRTATSGMVLLCGLYSFATWAGDVSNGPATASDGQAATQTATPTAPRVDAVSNAAAVNQSAQRVLNHVCAAKGGLHQLVLLPSGQPYGTEAWEAFDKRVSELSSQIEDVLGAFDESGWNENFKRQKPPAVSAAESARPEVGDRLTAVEPGQDFIHYSSALIERAREQGLTVATAPSTANEPARESVEERVLGMTQLLARLRTVMDKQQSDGNAQDSGGSGDETVARRHEIRASLVAEGEKVLGEVARLVEEVGGTRTGDASGIDTIALAKQRLDDLQAAGAVLFVRPTMASSVTTQGELTAGASVDFSLLTYPAGRPIATGLVDVTCTRGRPDSPADAAACELKEKPAQVARDCQFESAIALSEGSGSR